MKLAVEETTFILDQVKVHENLVQDYIKSVFRDFESHFKTKRVSEKL